MMIVTTPDVTGNEPEAQKAWTARPRLHGDWVGFTSLKYISSDGSSDPSESRFFSISIIISI